MSEHGKEYKEAIKLMEKSNYYAFARTKLRAMLRKLETAGYLSGEEMSYVKNLMKDVK